jgi:hypothetical protein
MISVFTKDCGGATRVGLGRVVLGTEPVTAERASSKGRFRRGLRRV